MKDMVRDPIPEFEKEQQGKLFIPTCDLTKNMWLSIVVKGMLDWMNLGRIFLKKNILMFLLSKLHFSFAHCYMVISNFQWNSFNSVCITINPVLTKSQCSEAGVLLQAMLNPAGNFSLLEFSMEVTTATESIFIWVQSIHTFLLLVVSFPWPAVPLMPCLPASTALHCSAGASTKAPGQRMNSHRFLHLQIHTHARKNIFLVNFA